MRHGLKDANAAAELFPQDPQPGQRPATLHEGHRLRLKQRFHDAGPQALPDYELLELVLFSAIPRRDTKPIAKALLKRFNGSFAEVINAPPERLKEVKGLGDAAIHQLKLVRAAALRLMQSNIKHREILNSWDAVLAYCRAAMAFEEVEQFRILFLDRKSCLIADELQQTGTVDHTPVYVREVVKRALELSASSIIMVHNHPSGDPRPSQADIDMTRLIVGAARALGIQVHDHLIVGRHGYKSMRDLKYM